MPPLVELVSNHTSSEYVLGACCGCVETTCPPLSEIPLPVGPSTGLGAWYAIPEAENAPASPLPDRSAALADPVSDNGQYSAGPSASIRCPYADAGVEVVGVVMSIVADTLGV